MEKWTQLNIIFLAVLFKDEPTLVVFHTFNLLGTLVLVYFLPLLDPLLKV